MLRQITAAAAGTLASIRRAHESPQRIGRAMERRAARYLKRRGLTVVTRNYRARGGEIDLVMHDGEALVFVEVRFRSESAFGDGIASVTPTKQRRVKRAAAAYLAHHPRVADTVCRFDVVSITRRHYRPVCTWIPDAFQ